MRFKIFVVTMLLITINLFAQDIFKGVVKYKITTDGIQTNMNYYTDGNNIKIEVKGRDDAIMIYKGDKMLMVMPSQKMYMEFPSQMMDMAKNMAANNEPAKDKIDMENIDQYRTGETKTIQGYDCEKLQYETDESSAEVWVTDELGNFMFMQNPMKGGGNSMFENFDGYGYFPMLVIVNDKSGKEITRLETTEVEKMNLDASTFEAPSGYKKMDMQGMMKQFQDQK